MREVHHPHPSTEQDKQHWRLSVVFVFCLSKLLNNICKRFFQLINDRLRFFLKSTENTQLTDAIVDYTETVCLKHQTNKMD